MSIFTGLSSAGIAVLAIMLWWQDGPAFVTWWVTGSLVIIFGAVSMETSLNARRIIKLEQEIKRLRS